MAFNSRTKDALELLVGAWQIFNPRHEVLADPGSWNGPDPTSGITSWNEMASLRPSRFLLQWVTISVVDQPWRTSHISFIFSFIHRIVENSCIAVKSDKLPIHFSTSVPESFGNESPLELQLMNTPMRTTLVLIDITHATADLGVITFVLIRITIVKISWMYYNCRCLAKIAGSAIRLSCFRVCYLSIATSSPACLVCMMSSGRRLF